MAVPVAIEVEPSCRPANQGQSVQWQYAHAVLATLLHQRSAAANTCQSRSCLSATKSQRLPSGADLSQTGLDVPTLLCHSASCHPYLPPLYKALNHARSMCRAVPSLAAV
eukprot:366025-Chlamydomonas_euryale.AAC.17